MTTLRKEFIKILAVPMKKKKVKEKKPKPPPPPAQQAAEKEFDFGGLPVRDLKKNLGCG